MIGVFLYTTLVLEVDRAELNEDSHDETVVCLNVSGIEDLRPAIINRGAQPRSQEVCRAVTRTRAVTLWSES